MSVTLTLTIDEAQAIRAILVAHAANETRLAQTWVQAANQPTSHCYAGHRAEQFRARNEADKHETAGRAAWVEIHRLDVLIGAATQEVPA